MKVEGDYTLNASRELIWKLLNDPDTLTRITPGVKHLDQIEEDIYNAIFVLKVGPVNGKFKGTIEAVDKIEPEKYTLKVQAKSPIGIISAEGTISLTLQPQGSQTHVLFSGEAKVMGTIARTGQRMMGAVSKKMIEQLFTNLEREIDSAGSEENQ